MDKYRLKIKIGEHEFEAEGPVEEVRSQFQSFKDIIANTPRQIDTAEKSTNRGEVRVASPGDRNAQLDKICRVDGRVVSLTVKPESEATAAILVMLGQKNYRDNETVTASQIKDGLEQSGYRPGRVDRIMQPLVDEGSVIRIGQRKGTRYRFTNQGLAKARITANEAVGQVS